MQNRKAILRDRQFQTFLDHEMKTPRESIPLDTITTLQCVSNNRVTDTATHFYCFEITTSQPKNGGNGNGVSDSMSSNPNLVMTSSSSGNVKQQRVSHLYGVGKESERGVWMQKILESLTNSMPVKYTCHYYRAGWCYLKNSITSEWSGTWLVLRKSQRRLIFVSEATGNVEKMDLRKARCIVLKESDESIDNLHLGTRDKDLASHHSGSGTQQRLFAGDQQLTRYDVPVIVDKCINFVYIHGSMSEGIYRKSGSENSMHKLMSAFRADAFNVEITRNEYNEHDVANVLKRFMRDLPERLLGKLTDSFVFVTELNLAAEKIPIYRELLARLSPIEHETLRRIVGHLVFISSQQTKNKMSVQNLTMIWGPTLLAKKSDELIYSQKEADVLSDLILLYKNLFPVSADEIKREQDMLACLQKYYAAAETLKDAVKQSGT
ncbi:arf-GAP with Rho-GAP domain, ANK repeat and PH domain-containing protein 2-like [Drosophila miranda]|uniref:arf-GAP with Rho-GAP domain, ANK repeat and PH domain-containing protein 2-like n=1 Tax=Drosophila miranda TaxID=7229 RepID=UPI00143F686B|nr:arf-GAP with Rho-GAP domain, ANK repeat and PH domain-containing protein 2-like [Drosophila miranda]